MTPTKPLLAATGLLDTLLHRLLHAWLPWSGRSQHTAWLEGYKAGLQEAMRRG